MTDPGGGAHALVRRSRLADLADLAGTGRSTAPPLSASEEVPERVSASAGQSRAVHQAATVAASQGGAEAQRRRFSEALATFRDTSVLVPVRDGGWLTADFGGIRWILAFSDKSALARYALAQGEGHAEWAYQPVSGARLLDVAVPAAKAPCGVALDAADGAGRALLLPPVAGIVPDAYAVNKGYTSEVMVSGAEEPE